MDESNAVVVFRLAQIIRVLRAVSPKKDASPEGELAQATLRRLSMIRDTKAVITAQMKLGLEKQEDENENSPFALVEGRREGAGRQGNQRDSLKTQEEKRRGEHQPNDQIPYSND